MNTSSNYIASKNLGGEAEQLRLLAITRWMSRDLMQAAVDFCRNIGLLPIYTEVSPDGLTRYLFWRPPQGAMYEIRTGRKREEFEALDRSNRVRNCELLSLHINEADIYSAVWISKSHFEIGKSFLQTHGVTVASRPHEKS